jgi:hypothetical protein
MVARDWDPEPLRATAAARAADAVTRHVAAVDATRAAAIDAEPEEPCADRTHGWRPEPWA